MRRLLSLLLPIGLALLVPAAMLRASDEEKPVARTYAPMLVAPMSQTAEQVAAKSDGCYSCHTRTDQPSMHASPAVQLGCVDCHGGDATVRGDPQLGFKDPVYVAARERAHVLPRYPHRWHYPDSANPKGSYTLLNDEAPEYIRFVNPGDYRVVRNSCGACHIEVIEAAERSGSLITAQRAAEQDREVFVVPGSPMDPRHAGSNSLIRDGAILTRGENDILSVMGLPHSPRQAVENPSQKSDDSTTAKVVEALGPTPTAVDELVRRCQVSAAAVAEVLLALELEGRLERHRGNRVSLM